MDADRYQRLKQLLFDASRRDGAERAKFLAEECSDDDSLREEVEELLRGARVDTSDLQAPVGKAVMGTMELPPPPWDCGHYRVEREVGRGGMGVVYEAHDQRDDSRVAIKFVPPLFASAPSLNQRFAREAELGRRVAHPNVVRTLDVGALERTGGPLSYLVMEFVEGISLRDLLHDLGTVPETLLREIAIQVSDGLTAIHDLGIVHRDMKPENVLLTEDRRVRITDLGVAKLRDATIELTGEGQFLGSLPYAAPEQCDAREVGPSSDLYALGVVLYELSTGSNPFRKDNPAASIHAHLDHSPTAARVVNPEISPFFSEVLSVLLSKDPRERFGSGAALRGVLEEGEEGAWWRSRSRPASGPLRPRIGVRRETALYGRDEELQLLKNAWEEAKAGTGSIVLIEGEAGIGKTRLVDALLADADPEDVHLLYGSYLPGGMLLGFCDAVIGHYGEANLEGALRPYFDAAPALLSPFVKMIRREPTAAGQGDLAGDALIAASGVLLRALAAEKPTLWVFDDLHDAPDAALRHFESMARLATNARILLIATSRPGIRDQVPEQLTRTGRFLRIPLERLPTRAVESIVGEVIGDPVLAETLGARIAAKSGGNPHFLFGILAALKAEGALEGTKAPEEIAIPSEIRDLVGARLSDLSRDERSVLDAAAVAGVRFDADLVAQVIGEPVIAILQALAEMERRRGIVRAAGRLYRFGHNLLQEVVYGELPERLRHEYHTRLADAFAAGLRDAPSGSDAAFLARHYLRGTDPQRGLEFLPAALDDLEGRYLHEEALDLIDRALALESVKGIERLRLMFRRIDRLSYLARRDRQREAITEATQLAEVLGDPALRARTWIFLGAWYQMVGREPEGLEAYQRAGELAALSGDRCLEADVLTRVGNALARLRRGSEAVTNLKRARRLAMDLGDHVAEMSATANLAQALRHLTRYDESAEMSVRAIELASTVGNRRDEAHQRGQLGILRTYQGRWREAETELRAQIEFARSAADRRLESQATGNLGLSLLAEGKLGAARELIERYRLLCAEVGNRRAESVAAGALGELECAVGNYEAARELTEEGHRRAVETHAPQLAAENSRTLGRIALAEGQPSEALAHFRAAADSLGGIASRDDLAGSLTEIALVEVTLGNADAARDALDQAIAIGEALPTPARLILALARRAELTKSGADAARARDLLEAHGAIMPLSDRIEAAWSLYRATEDSSMLAAARADLDEFIAQAAPSDQPGMRERLPIVARIGAADGPSR
ncbi:MAG: serine/threonine-protein kinase [Planctomycetota bacterium]